LNTNSFHAPQRNSRRAAAIHALRAIHATQLQFMRRRRNSSGRNRFLVRRSRTYRAARSAAYRMPPQAAYIAFRVAEYIALAPQREPVRRSAIHAAQRQFMRIAQFMQRSCNSCAEGAIHAAERRIRSSGFAGHIARRAAPHIACRRRRHISNGAESRISNTA